MLTRLTDIILEDAYVLGRLLAHPRTTIDRVPAVLKIYESARLDPSKEITRTSHEAGLLYELRGPEGENRELAEVGKAILKRWAWLWTAESAVQEWERIESLLVQS